MLIEGLKPLCIVFADCAVHLAPGYPVYFSDEQARKVLEKAGGKVRVLSDPGHAATGKLSEGKSVKWRLAKGICGPAMVQIIDCTKDGRWVLVWHEDYALWIHESNVIQQIV